MKTKKTLKIVCLCILSSLLLFASAQAKITNNVCSNCHTMHNSQNASSMRLGDAGVQGFGEDQCLDCHSSTRSVLLRYDCLGCHAKEINTANKISSDGWPQIALNTGIAWSGSNSPYLAGGNYKYVFTIPPYGDEYGHNVHGFGNANINNPDGNIGYTPPGYDSDYDPSTGGFQPGAGSEGIMCAGQNGCHGNREQSWPYLAMKATHHADDAILRFGSILEGSQGTTAGTSYRFLYNIHGGEDSDWQATFSVNDHNEYKGAAYAARPLAGGQSWGNIETISQFCAECHGYFHASDEITDTGGSPWKRHPTDASLPNSGEYSVYSIYSTQAPVARVNIPMNPSGAVTPAGTTDDIVMCLSCHRAHASEFPDILRWDYSEMVAGDSSKSGGCFTCHTTKNTSP